MQSKMYVGAGLILRNNRHHIILVCDARSGRWGFPKGHPEHEDKKNPINTAIRGCKEETGLQHDVDYTIDTVKGKRIGKRLYFTGICLIESFDRSKFPAGEIRDVQWWSLGDMITNEHALNSDLRCWLRKARFSRSPTFGPAVSAI